MSFVTIEGVRVVEKLIAAATKPAALSPDPLVRRITECMLYSAEKVESYASTLDLLCANATAKKRARSSHKKLEREERRQEAEQVLVREIRGVSVCDGIEHALESAKAAFTRLLKKKMHSLETQQRPAVRRRVVARRVHERLQLVNKE